MCLVTLEPSLTRWSCLGTDPSDPLCSCPVPASLQDLAMPLAYPTNEYVAASPETLLQGSLPLSFF